MNERMQVKRIEKEDDRWLLYAHEESTRERYGEYHVIANPDCGVQLGNEIEYEPYGFNFGWFVSIAKLAVRSKHIPPYVIDNDSD